MLIIGERINSSRPDIQKAIRARDAVSLAQEMRSQFEAGAKVLDINCAMGLDDELDDIDWVTDVLQREIPDAGLCIDSPNCLAIERALTTFKGRGEVFINSVTAEKSKISTILPLAVKHRANLIALVMGEDGMPSTKAQRVEIAAAILAAARHAGLDETRLYFDPLIRPLATEPEQASEVLASIGLIKSLGPVRTICGVSNISYGLPRRSLINSSFLGLALAAGLDAAILDPTDRRIVSAMLASEALLGRDTYCRNYLAAFRKGLI